MKGYGLCTKLFPAGSSRIYENISPQLKSNTATDHTTVKGDLTSMQSFNLEMKLSILAATSGSVI